MEKTTARTIVTKNTVVRLTPGHEVIKLFMQNSAERNMYPGYKC